MKTPKLPAGYQRMTQAELRRWMTENNIQGLVRVRMWTKWINRKVQNYNKREHLSQSSQC